jgi:hypothetical protein
MKREREEEPEEPKEPDSDTELTFGVDVPKLRPFIPSTLPLDFVCTLIGKCATGKTFWATWLVHALMFRYSRVFVMTGSRCNGHFQKFVHPEDIYEGYNDEVVNAIIKECEEISDKQRETGIDYNYRVLLILDDVTSDKDIIRYSKSLTDIYTKHRHIHVSIVSLLHGRAVLTNVMRQMSSVVGIFKTGSLDAKEGLFKDFGDLVTKKEFFAMMNHYASGKHLLICRCSRNSSKLERAYEVSIAEEAPPFKVPRIFCTALGRPTIIPTYSEIKAKSEAEKQAPSVPKRQRK